MKFIGHHSITACAVVFLLGCNLLCLTSCHKGSHFRIEGIPGRSVVHADVVEALYFPNAELPEDYQRVAYWDQKLSYQFLIREGEDYVIHFLHPHYDEFEVIHPDYSYQVNLQIKAEDFKQGRKLKPNQLKGYLSWGNSRDVERLEYREISSGFVKLLKIREDGSMLAAINLYFKNYPEQQSIHVYGHFKGQATAIEKFYADQKKVIEEIHRRADNLDRENWRGWEKAGYR